MTTATMDRIKSNLKKREVESKTAAPDFELTHITFELYPEEILMAAAEDLGPKALPEYVIEIYKFGQLAQSSNSQVKLTQLQGLVLTHTKLTKWLEKKGAKHFCDIGNKAILRAFIEFHEKRLAESLEALSIINKEMMK